MRVECATCYYSDDPQGTGHCYMFRNTPDIVYRKGYCLSYTANNSLDYVAETLDEKIMRWTDEEENC